MKKFLFLLLAVCLPFFFGCNQKSSKPQIVKYYDGNGSFRGASSVDSIVIDYRTMCVDTWFENKIAHKWLIRDTILPKYPGGDNALLSYLANYKYPESAKKNKIEGKIFLNFTVSEDGTISEPKILKGLTDDCNNEAIKMVTNMPKWTPSYINGNPAKFKFVVPFQLKLN